MYLRAVFRSINSRSECSVRHGFPLGVLQEKTPVLLEVEHGSERLLQTGTRPPPVRSGRKKNPPASAGEF